MIHHFCSLKKKKQKTKIINTPKFHNNGIMDTGWVKISYKKCFDHLLNVQNIYKIIQYHYRLIILSSKKLKI